MFLLFSFPRELEKKCTSLTVYCFSSENNGLYQLKKRQLSLLHNPLSEGEIDVIESTFLFSLMVLVIQYIWTWLTRTFKLTSFEIILYT